MVEARATLVNISEIRKMQTFIHLKIGKNKPIENFVSVLYTIKKRIEELFRYPLREFLP
jgi:hypothetical protein